MTPQPQSKKQKIDLQDLATEVWEHYRNYLDSLESEDEIGDIDELQELIELASPYVNPLGSTLSIGDCKQVTDLLPVLLSVAYYHLADVAISQYLVTSENLSSAAESAISSEQAKEIESLLTKSLEYYPENAATWSMGANFGRMSHRLSLATTRAFYERAVEYCSKLRPAALAALEDEESIGDELVNEWIELMILNQILGVELEGDEEDERDEEKDMEEENVEEEEKEETEDQYSSSTIEATSRFMCAMLWSMGGNHDKALHHLQKFPLTHRLHPNIWSISNDKDIDNPRKAPLVFRPDNGILPENLYCEVKQLFAPNAVYWNESSYSNRGYYSYFMEYQKNSPPRNLIEDIIVNYLLPRAEQVLDEDEASSICGFEWWVHTRPIQANLGHNLHFDTDESMLAQEGKVTHPILSSVLYLTGGGDAGTTILVDQTPDSDVVADICWQSVPKDNSFLLFPGNLLHGVLPCPGPLEKKAEIGNEASIQNLINGWQAPHNGNQSPNRNRLTFMVGFWTRNVPETMKERHLYGPCGPLPPTTEEHTWVREMSEPYMNRSTKKCELRSSPKTIPAVSLPQVTPAWETIKADKMDEEKPPLCIPHAIDHRFFVNGAPQCFRKSLFEDLEGECE